MPFVSNAQRKWMWAKHPEMAKRWQEHTPKDKKLPEHVESSEGKEKRSSLLSLILVKRADDGQQTAPPGLRPAGVLGGPSCQTCKYFDGKGTCMKYSYPVKSADTCDSFEPMDVGTDKVVQPEQPMRAIAQGPEEIGAPPESKPELPDTPMDEAKHFKFAFLLKCAEEGLDSRTTLERVRAARRALKKQANLLDTVTGLGKSLADVGMVAGVGIPVAAGALTGLGIRRMQGPPTTSPLSERLRLQKRKSLADEYERLADEAEYKQQLREAAGKTGLIRLS